MNRKTIIMCVTVTCVFVMVVSVALFFLYSGTDKSKNGLADTRDFMLFSAVPSDALSVMKFSDLASMTECLVSEQSALHYFVTEKAERGKMVAFLEKLSASSSLYNSAMSSPAVMSVHNIGDLTPLLILDAGKSGANPAEAVDSLNSLALRCGLTAQYTDASDIAPAGSPLRKRSLMLISPSDILVQSSLRHLKSDISVWDVPGFAESVRMSADDAMLILPASGVEKTLTAIFSSKYRAYPVFFRKYADCTSFSITNFDSETFSMAGRSYSEGGASDFMNVFSKVDPSVPEVASILPAYTIHAEALPLADVSAYIDAYFDFCETQSLSKTLESEFSALEKRGGIDPADWAESLNIREVAKAAYVSGGTVETVLLVHVGKKDSAILTKEGASSKDGGNTVIRNYAWTGYLSALFGPLFSTDDEAHFILENGWMIIGSRNALEEYTSGRAVEYTLAEYFADASIADGLSGKSSYFVSYHSLMEDESFTEAMFAKNFLPAVKASFGDISYEPVFFSVEESKSGMELNFRLHRTTVTKSQAPTFERDTSVPIPEGPFRVKNSGTGKMNLFYQQDNLYLCLQEEGGKGLWGVPFDAPICGCAQTVDYYANGKLQILFASGTKLHLIDRLGRFVNPPFPVNLGKEILLGPDVYDFSGRRKYNVMVLHTDNTIEMYNLQGRRPPEWKTITSSETIKGLPERIRVGGNTYWVVRTSIQTLIFGFYGGNTLTDFSGDRMIRPDSEVKPTGDNAVEVVCYDGRKHTVKLN